jgi:outer membrane protein TolC
MATAADLLQAQVYLSSVQQKLIEVRNLIAVAGQNIELLTATPIDLPLAPAVSSAGRVEHAGGILDQIDPTQVGDRSDLLSWQEKARAADRMVGVARGAVLPHINLSVHRDLFSQENLFGDDARSWTLGVYATWDIFKGMQNIGEIKKAQAQRRAAEHMADFETRQARVQATEAWLAARAAHQKVTVARDAVAAAREGLRIVTNQYREGLASMVDLLDIQAATTMAEGNLVQAQHDFQVGLANLEFAGARSFETTAPGNESLNPQAGQ